MKNYQEIRLGADENLRLDGGVSYKYIESQIRDNQSPYMLNLNADDRGGLTKRSGYKLLHSFSEGPIHAVISYQGYQVVAHGTKLTKYVESTDTETLLMSGLSNSKGVFFIFNDILYYLNGVNYIQYNGTTASNVVGYIPTLTLSRAPTGGGNPYEQWNLLSAGFKDSFSGTGSATAYTLSLTNLDVTAVTATVNGVAKTEGTDFTVNRTTGVVTFNVAPAAGTNNVVITAYKTQTGFANRIKNCKYAEIYGGTNDTRIFVAGNPTYPNQYWYCGLLDPTYWPENYYNRIGTTNEDITGFIKHYETLVIFKEKSIYSITFTFDADGNPSFPSKNINATVGCDMPYSIQLIENDPVFANTYAGVFILLSSELKDEKNIKPLSGNINGAESRAGLLNETHDDLANSTSLDHKGKYYLCVGSKVWIWDYNLTPYGGNDEVLSWFYYENISANAWFVDGHDLYWGERNTVKLQKATPEIYNDNGVPINSVWKSKLFNFGLPDWLKNIKEAWFSTRALAWTQITPKYYVDEGEIAPVAETITKTGTFSWKTFAWNRFIWAVNRFTPTEKLKIKLKKTIHFQIEFSNNNLNENLSIMSLVIKYILNRKVK